MSQQHMRSRSSGGGRGMHGKESMDPVRDAHLQEEQDTVALHQAQLAGYTLRLHIV